MSAARAAHCRRRAELERWMWALMQPPGAGTQPVAASFLDFDKALAASEAAAVGHQHQQQQQQQQCQASAVHSHTTTVVEWQLQ